MRIEVREKPWDLVFVMGLASLLLGIVFIIETGILQIILGLVFVLFLPGYVIISALFPKSEEIENIERIALSFGLSLAVVPLIGLILNYSPFGIKLFPMIISLYVLIICVSCFAWYRRYKLPIDQRFNIILSINLPKFKSLASIDKILTILLVIAVIFTALVISYVILVPKKGESYTEFHILNENKTMGNYPNNITTDDSGAVIIKVVCHEYEITNYIIEVNLINQTGERENRTLRYFNFTLKHEQHNEIAYLFTVNEIGTYKLQFLLYVDDNSEPYRDLYIWIDIIS